MCLKVGFASALQYNKPQDYLEACFCFRLLGRGFPLQGKKRTVELCDAPKQAGN